MKPLAIALFAFLVPCARSQGLGCAIPPHYSAPGYLPIVGSDGSGGDHVQFAYSATTNAGGTTLDNAVSPFILFPSKGTTPATLQVALNPAVVAQYQPGLLYTLNILFTTVGLTPSRSTGCTVQVDLTTSHPAPAIQAVLNAASLQPNISPGAMVSILGSNLAGPTLSTTFDPTASYPSYVAGTLVSFNGIAAPLLYISPTQINAIVPFALAGQSSAQVVIDLWGVPSATFTLPLLNTSPGIFTATQNGTGQGAILQQGSDGQFSYNSSANPAAAGQALEIFATGMGVWTPAPQSDVFLSGEPFTTQPVSVTIGGQPAKVLYAGTLGASLSSWSVLQVNVTVPSGLTSGAQPVVLKIGANDNSQQKVTVWIQ